MMAFTHNLLRTIPLALTLLGYEIYARKQSYVSHKATSTYST